MKNIASKLIVRASLKEQFSHFLIEMKIRKAEYKTRKNMNFMFVYCTVNNTISVH